MKNFSFLWLLSCFLLNSNAIFGQGTKTTSWGTLLSPEILASYELENQANVTKRGNVEDYPMAYSLLEYCPRPSHQIGPTCAAYAAGYNALTIMYAQQQQERNVAEITNLAFDPLYIYNKVRTNKSEYKNSNDTGLDLREVLDFMKDKGAISARDLAKEGLAYYQQKNNSRYAHKIHPSKYPKGLKNTKIDGYKVLSTHKDSTNCLPILSPTVLAAIKSSVYKGNPPIALMAPASNDLTGQFQLKSFNSKEHHNGYWVPSTTEQPIRPLHKEDAAWRGYKTHALTIIAYDDNKIAPNGKKGAFQVVNSWEPDWKAGGFAWITYEDAENWFVFVAAPTGLVNKILQPIVVVDSPLEKPESQLRLLENDQVVKILAGSNQTTQAFVSQTRFTLNLTISQPSYAYVLITDTTKFVTTLFDCPKMLSKDAEVPIPFTSDYTTGMDKVIIFYTNTPIQNIDSLKNSLEANLLAHPNDSLLSVLALTFKAFGWEFEKAVSMVESDSNPTESIQLQLSSRKNVAIGTILNIPHID